MILGTRKFFVYVDHRLDTGEPFYVGKGDAARLSKIKRNLYHSNIVEKHGFRRDVVLETIDEAYALQKEIDLIKELRTREIFGGANFTDGGDGISGLKFSDEAIERNRILHTGRVYSEEICLKKSNSMLRSNKVKRKSVQQFDLVGNLLRTFGSMCEIERFLDKKGVATLISRCCSGKTRTSYGHVWKYSMDDKVGSRARPVIRCTETGIYIDEFGSVKLARERVKVSPSTIHASLNSGLPKRGYIWKYKEV